MQRILLEKDRLSELDSYFIFDTKEVPDFDFMTRLAAEICDTKIALISFITKNKQWVKSNYGLDFREIQKKHSICAQTIYQQDEVLIVNDLQKDNRFQDNPLVKDPPNLIFYAGVPLVNNSGIPLGTLCVMDDKPRELSKKQIQWLKSIANQTLLLLEQKRNQSEIIKQNRILKGNRDMATILFDKNKKITFASPAITSMLECSVESLISHSILDIIYPDHRIQVARQIKEIISKADSTVSGVSFRANLRDGTWKWLDATFTNLIKDPNINGIACYIRDSAISMEPKNDQILAQLKDNEIKLNRVQQIAKLGYWQLQPDDQKLYWSDEVYRIWGVEKDKFELSFDAFFSTIYPEDRPKFNEEQELALKGQKALDIEHRIILPDGSVKWVHEIGQLEKDLDGNPVVFHGTVQDIHQNKLAELELLRFKQIIDNSLDGIAIADNMGRSLFLNPAFSRLLGYTVQELEQKGGPHLVYADQEKAQDVFESLLSGNHWSGDVDLVNRQGEIINFYLSGGPIFNHKKELTAIYGIHTDISKRKLAEFKLQQSIKTLEDFKFALDQSAIVAVTDKDGIIQSVNDTFCELSKFNRDELVGKTHKIINSGHHPKAFFKEMWSTITSGKVWRGEIKNKAKDGTYYWVDATIVPVLDQHNKPVQYLAIRFEISARKEADEKIRALLIEKENILESIGDGFFTLDKTWNVTYWNKKAEQIIGIKREAILGRNLWEVFPDAVKLEFYRQYYHAMNTGQIVVFEELYPALNLWLEVSVYPSENGLSIYFKDISTRKMADEEIRLSNERFEKVSQATNDAIWDWDIVSNTLYWGIGFKTLFGHQVQKITATLQSWTEHIHPDDLDSVIKSLEKVINDPKKTNWVKEYRYIKENKEYAFVVDRGVVIRDESGKGIRMVGAMADITYRRKYEESLKRLNQALENHTKELELSNEELEQFAFVVSHDLQEPLRMITGFLSQLERKYRNQLDEKAIQYIGFATDGAKRMKQIILDLLEFSRIGKLNHEKEKIDLNELINDYKILRRRNILSRSVKLIYKDLPVIMAYKVPIMQIMHNLLDNALKYSKEDVSPEIRIKVKENKNKYTISIQDNGIGIEKDYFDKIFIIFQRLHHSEKYSGTGMGLAIVKKNVERFGGEIWLESEIGQGTTFYFTLPK